MNSSTELLQRAVEMDWKKATIAERAKYLLSLNADCEFLVGANGSNQELIKANKTFLGMSSPVFEKMFSIKMTEGAGVPNQPISIPDLTPSSFIDLLMYMYSDSLDIQTMDHAIDLCYAAQKYMMQDLVAKCLQYVKENLSPKYAITILEFIKLFEDETIKVKCCNLLRDRTPECLDYLSDFEYAHESTVLAIVKEESLNIPEFDLFSALARWAKRQCIQKDLEINGTNLRQALKKILGWIRFLAMTQEEFSSSAVISLIFSQTVWATIYHNIRDTSLRPLAGWTMPVNLSSSRKSRQSRFFSESGGSSRTECLREMEFRHLVTLEPSAPFDVSVTVDKDIMIAGIIIANILPGFNGTMKLSCALYQANDTFTSLVTSVIVSKSSHSNSIKPIFERPFELKRDIKYLIRIAVNERARGISGTASSLIYCQGVRFQFASDDGDQNGLVRGIILSPC